MPRSKHNKLRRTAVLRFLLLLLWTGSAFAQDADTESTAKALQKTVERLNALDQWFSEADRKRSVWLAEVQKHDRDISKLNKEVNDTQSRLNETEDELAELESDINSLKTQQKSQAEHIAKHVGAAYRLTGQDFLKQLLNQESPDTLDRMMRYHRYFSESRLEVLAEYRTTLVQLDEANVALSDTQATLNERQQQLQVEQGELTGERAERAELIKTLDQEKETKAEEYARLTRDRDRLENLLAELRSRSSELDGSAFIAARGALPMPVTGSVRHAFGSRRADNRLRWHGIDISARHGAPVTAVFRGRVIFSDWLRGFGFLTIIDHGSDYMTLYGHVDVLMKQVGDVVESGEIIASAGNSGGSQDSGLYFEVRHKGEPKDPISWIDRG